MQKLGTKGNVQAAMAIGTMGIVLMVVTIAIYFLADALSGTITPGTSAAYNFGNTTQRIYIALGLLSIGMIVAAAFSLLPTAMARR